MSDEVPRNNDRLERLLRQWGAEEAARREDVSAPPRAAWRRAGPASMLARWLPLAAGFLFFASGAGLFIAAQNARRQPSGGETVAGAAALRAELDQASKELAESRSSLAEARRLLDDQKQAAALETARLQQALEAEKADIQAQAKRDLAALNRTIDEKDATLKDTLAKLEKRDKLLASLQPEQRNLAAMYQQLKKSHDALAAETARLRQSQDDALAAQHEAEKKLQGVEAQQASLLALWQQTSLATGASGEEGIRALQKLARDGRILHRGAALRDRLSNAALRRLFDAQEVLLTQLDLLDPRQRSEVESFARRIQSVNAGPLITDVLNTLHPDPEVKAWLIESQLLLGGVKNEG